MNKIRKIILFKKIKAIVIYIDCIEIKKLILMIEKKN